MRTDDYVNELLQYLIQFEVLQGDDDHDALLQEFNGGEGFLWIISDILMVELLGRKLTSLLDWLSEVSSKSWLLCSSLSTIIYF